MQEVVIDSIRVSLLNYQRVVVLRGKESDRYLPIWIGPAEADAIAVKLQDLTVPRPLTHDLLGSIVASLGASIDRIVVSDLSNDTFFAKIVLSTPAGRREIDCRPSDALAVAVRVPVPIFVEEVVMQKASIPIDKEAGKALDASSRQAGAPADDSVSQDELDRMSAFQDFIQNLKGLEEIGGERDEAR